MFLSDNVSEVDAATSAGMLSMAVDRPGNAPLSDEDKERLAIVKSLEEIEIDESDDEDVANDPSESEQ